MLETRFRKEGLIADARNSISEGGVDC